MKKNRNEKVNLHKTCERNRTQVQCSYYIRMHEGLRVWMSARNRGRTQTGSVTSLRVPLFALSKLLLK